MSQFSKTPTGSSIIRQQMADAIFGSNAIEFVGSTAKVTQRLCDLVFADKACQANLFDPGADYEEELDHAASLGRKRDLASVMRGRREIIQHALAFKYLVQRLVVDQEQLSERLIQRVHILLCHQTEESHIGGEYRTHAEAAKWGRREETDEEYKIRVTNFLKYKPGRQAPPRNDNIPIYESKFVGEKRVPALMAQLVEEYANDTANAHKSRSNAPMLAAKYCSAFANIHPFEDGNGRVCRMLLNAILIKYTGLCIEIGTEFSEREKWIGLSNAANKGFLKEFRDDVDWNLQTSHRGIGALVLRKLERLRIPQIGLAVPNGLRSTGYVHLCPSL